MEVEDDLRYKLPVCVVIFNNDGIYRGTTSTRRFDPAPTVFVKGARYTRYGGVRRRRRQCDVTAELKAPSTPR